MSMPRKRFSSLSGSGAGAAEDGAAAHAHTPAAAAAAAGLGPPSGGGAWGDAGAAAPAPATAPAPSGGGSKGGSAGGAAAHPERSIYDVWTSRKRYMLLGLMSFATFLVPYSDTVYLPALSVIQKDLGTTATLVRPREGAAAAAGAGGGGGRQQGLARRRRAGGGSAGSWRGGRARPFPDKRAGTRGWSLTSGREQPPAVPG
jgi:hypothetical protein